MPSPHSANQTAEFSGEEGLVGAGRPWGGADNPVQDMISVNNICRITDNVLQQITAAHGLNLSSRGNLGADSHTRFYCAWHDN